MAGITLTCTNQLPLFPYMTAGHSPLPTNQAHGASKNQCGIWVRPDWACRAHGFTSCAHEPVPQARPTGRLGFASHPLRGSSCDPSMANVRISPDSGLIKHSWECISPKFPGPCGPNFFNFSGPAGEFCRFLEPCGPKVRFFLAPRAGFFICRVLRQFSQC